MNLCLDIGNSTVALGLFSGSKLMQRTKLDHGRRLNQEMVHTFLERSLGSRSVQRAAIVSVVPEYTEQAAQAVQQLLNVTPAIITVQTFKGIKHAYRSPKKLGTDRLVNAYAAWRLYGAPAVAVDIGTAITWDAVDRRGTYLGGAIAPGPGTMAAALHQQTTQLPQLAAKRVAAGIGRDTDECIRAGIYWGVVAMVRELAERMKKQLGGKARVIVTGGAGALFMPDMKGMMLDGDLTLKGINLALEEMKRKEQEER